MLINSITGKLPTAHRHNPVFVIWLLLRAELTAKRIELRARDGFWSSRHRSILFQAGSKRLEFVAMPVFPDSKLVFPDANDVVKDHVDASWLTLYMYHDASVHSGNTISACVAAWSRLLTVYIYTRVYVCASFPIERLAHWQPGINGETKRPCRPRRYSMNRNPEVFGRRCMQSRWKCREGVP